MAQFNKIQTLQAIIQTGMVPAYYNKEVGTAEQVAGTYCEGGVGAFEFINRGDFTHEVFDELVEYAVKECLELVLGVGSTVDPTITALFIQLGTNFVVGSLSDPEVTKICDRRLIPYMPGYGSVSEIDFAQEVGCDLCKTFPTGNVGGPSFIRNIETPMPQTLITTIGTVEPAEGNLSAWFEASVIYAETEPELLPKETIAGSGWQSITGLCRNALSVTQEYR